ncbi:MAG: hypothetical protein AMJ79_11960 [Phycisphaerae bacterium SM23_30]|nr:MAG: hypothetical protein AMJ79_11960 [Phycisphaerae bacterium SM23_30]
MKFKIATMIIMMMMTVMFIAGTALGQTRVSVSPPSIFQVKDVDVPVAYLSSLTAWSAAGPEVLIIPGDEPMTDEETAATAENMQIMARLFETRLQEKNLMHFPSVITNLGYWVSQNSSDDIESIYLKGYGALFLLKTDFPLLPSVKMAPAPPKQAKDILWNKIKQDLTAPPARSRAVARTTTRPRTASAKKYNEQKIEEFKQTLLEALVHACNMNHVADNEWVTIHVTGPGREIVESAKKIGAEDAQSDSRVDFAADRKEQETISYGSGASSSRSAAANPTHLLIRARKNLINDLADEDITFEEFKNEVTTIIY